MGSEGTIQPLTKREAAIIAAYTGYLIGEFSEMHKYIEEVMGRPVFTHEMVLNEFMKQLHEKSKQDFVSIHVQD